MRTPNNEVVDLATVAMILAGGGGLVVVALGAIVGGVVWISNNYGTIALIVFMSALSAFLLISGIAARVGYVKYVEEDRRY